MRRTIIALLLFVSGAATGVAQPAKQNPPAQAPQKGHCDVGVVSRLGEKFRVSIAYKVSEYVPVESWHIDDLVVDRIRAALGKRAVVQRIPYRKELVVMRPLFFGRAMDGPASFRRMATGTRCARYVFVSPGKEDDVNYADLVGLGIIINSTVVRYAFVYAIVVMSVYDGETFSFLRSAIGIAPHREVDESFWPDSPSSAAQKAKLRDVTRELVAQELDRKLPKLLLTP